jgi:hypothetical protein
MFTLSSADDFDGSCSNTCVFALRSSALGVLSAAAAAAAAAAEAGSSSSSSSKCPVAPEAPPPE